MTLQERLEFYRDEKFFVWYLGVHLATKEQLVIETRNGTGEFSVMPLSGNVKNGKWDLYIEGKNLILQLNTDKFIINQNDDNNLSLTDSNNITHIYKSPTKK